MEKGSGGVCTDKDNESGGEWSGGGGSAAAESQTDQSRGTVQEPSLTHSTPPTAQHQMRGWGGKWKERETDFSKPNMFTVYLKTGS